MLIDATSLVIGVVKESREKEERAARRQDMEAHLKKEAQKIADLYLKENPEKTVEVGCRSQLSHKKPSSACDSNSRGSGRSAERR